MKSLEVGPKGSRIASVHNGSSLFTGDAGGGESNIRRYLIENDLLEAIIQLPNNLFYNTGITTYIWLLSNHKAEDRKGKVQLIDASQRFEKLRKNLGSKNCEFKAHHIQEIMAAYRGMKVVDRYEDEDLASKVFDNADFGYYKVTIERPRRLKSQFSKERIAPLRFDKKLQQPMQWAWETYGDRVYTDLANLEEPIMDWCEAQELDLNNKQKSSLLSDKLWEKHRLIWEESTRLMEVIGLSESSDFNAFRENVLNVIKLGTSKLSATEKKLILETVSWYDAEANKVIKSVRKLKPEKLEELLARLGCTEEQLFDHGYYPDGKGAFIEYETESDLRDYENVPLKEEIHTYFLREVQPHVTEAWINLEATKIGYEISFNKYFYRHRPLRPLEVVSAEILQLEKESEGLIADILGLS